MNILSKIYKFLSHPRLIILYLAEHKVLRLSDKTYIKIYFNHYMNYKLNLNNPKTFNEKLQWLKIHDRNQIYSKLVDKYEVKKYIAEKIGDEYVIPTIKVCENMDNIDLSTLPEKFVLKATHDSGSVKICRSKKDFNFEKVKKELNKSLKKNFYEVAREWPYKDVKPRIMIEQYMEDEVQKQLIDYKFYCFNGIPHFLYISSGLENHESAKISFLNLDWTFAPFSREDYDSFEKLPPKPKNFENMIEIAKKLSKDFTFIRVDLYEINDKVYFSELTFTPCSGVMPFSPSIYDEKIGELLQLPIN